MLTSRISRSLQKAVPGPIAPFSNALRDFTEAELKIINDPTAPRVVKGKSKVVPPNVLFSRRPNDFFTVTEARKRSVLSEHIDPIKHRKATIYFVEPPYFTSGRDKIHYYAIRLDSKQRWVNHLMGWSSSDDMISLQASQMKFETVEQAILFCERSGLKYDVENTVPAPTIARPYSNEYSHNFLPKELREKIKFLGPKRALRLFAYDASPVNTGNSPWVNYKYTKRGDEEWKPRTDGSYAKGIPQGPNSWIGPQWPAYKWQVKPVVT